MKSKTKTKSTETLAPSTYSQPYIDSAAATLRPAFEQSQQLVNQYLPQAQEGVDYYTRQMNGENLNGNPYLDGMITESNQSIADSVNSQFSGAGRYGSGHHAKLLADRIGANENQMRFANYGQERQYQNNAALQRQGLIESITGMPQQAAGQYAGGVNALLGRYATSNSTGTQTSSPGLGQLIGTGLQAAGMFASDRRLKSNVERVGTLPDGLGVYEYDYIAGHGLPEERQRGVMADEVAILRPYALGPQIAGYATVDYSKLGGADVRT